MVNFTQNIQEGQIAKGYVSDPVEQSTDYISGAIKTASKIAGAVGSNSTGTGAGSKDDWTSAVYDRVKAFADANKLTDEQMKKIMTDTTVEWSSLRNVPIEKGLQHLESTGTLSGDFIRNKQIYTDEKANIEAITSQKNALGAAMGYSGDEAYKQGGAVYDKIETLNAATEQYAEASRTNNKALKKMSEDAFRLTCSQISATFLEQMLKTKSIDEIIKDLSNNPLQVEQYALAMTNGNREAAGLAVKIFTDRAEALNRAKLESMNKSLEEQNKLAENYIKNTKQGLIISFIDKLGPGAAAIDFNVPFDTLTYEDVVKVIGYLNEKSEMDQQTFDVYSAVTHNSRTTGEGQADFITRASKDKVITENRNNLEQVLMQSLNDTSVNSVAKSGDAKAIRKFSLASSSMAADYLRFVVNDYSNEKISVSFKDGLPEFKNAEGKVIKDPKLYAAWEKLRVPVYKAIQAGAIDPKDLDFALSSAFGLGKVVKTDFSKALKIPESEASAIRKISPLVADVWEGSEALLGAIGDWVYNLGASYGDISTDTSTPFWTEKGFIDYISPYVGDFVKTIVTAPGALGALVGKEMGDAFYNFGKSGIPAAIEKGLNYTETIAKGSTKPEKTTISTKLPEQTVSTSVSPLEIDEDLTEKVRKGEKLTDEDLKKVEEAKETLRNNKDYKIIDDVIELVHKVEAGQKLSKEEKKRLEEAKEEVKKILKELNNE